MNEDHARLGLYQETLSADLLALADEITIPNDTHLTQQYHPVEYIYYQLSGRVEFFIQLGVNGEKLSVAVNERNGAMIGWSGLRSPNRYATSVQTRRECKLLRWKQTELMAYFQQHPDTAIDFLEGVLETGFDLLQQTRILLRKSLKQPITKLNYATPISKTRFQLDRETIISWLQSSSFFEDFSEASQNILLENTFLQRCYSGEKLFSGNQPGDTLYILVSGSVNLYYESLDDSEGDDSEGDGAVFLRSLSSQGQVLSALSVRHNYQQGLTAIANQDSLFCCLSIKDLKQCALQNAQFGLELQHSLLTLLGNHLRSSRAQLINQIYDNEVFNITGILEQAAPQLAVTSGLHKVPHLLENRLTQGDAFRCLELAQSRGTPLEKNLAGLCLDILQETRSEFKFYQGIQQVYQSVVDLPPETDAKQSRKDSAALFREAFKHVRYRMSGEENLPDRPGHIFILNHLVSHPYHVLPNHFELSLDTNFVSSIILDNKYGDSGIRVVRKGRQDEYAHYNYYSRMDYINVLTDESAQTGDEQTGKQQLTRFLSEATNHLQQGKNIVICPEGRSLWSAESPGLFKPGAFMLAASIEPEPYIVPLALANFDKRLRNTCLAAVIKPPFRVSEQVDVADKTALNTFLNEYQAVYRGYVEEAQGLAGG